MKNGKMNGGFGSAMFAIKDIQNMYGSFDIDNQKQKKNEQVKKQEKKVEQKNVIVKQKEILKKVEQKPKILLQPSISKKTVKTVQNPVTLSKEVKQPIQQKTTQNLTTSKLLNQIKVEQRVFELSFNQKQTVWNKEKFNDQGKKPCQIVPSPKVSFSLNERNVRQGRIGNCYFICSLAALAGKIQTLKKAIPEYEKYNEKNETINVNLFESGKLIKLKVKNSFQENYSKPIENDITSLIFEKAYAQMYGGYDIINVGHSIDAFRDLSGNMAEYINLKDQKQCSLQIMQAFEQRQPMVIASKIKPIDSTVSPKHSYNVLSYSLKNKKLFLELRDPRGWTKANFNVPSQLKCDIENGEFWVGHDDLVKNFEVITVSRHIQNSFYYYKTFNAKQLPANGLRAMSFQLDEITHVNFSINQKNKKFFDDKYHYKVISLMICEMSQTNQIVKTIKANFNSQQVCTASLELKKGTYAIVGQIYPFKPAKLIYPNEVFTFSLNSTRQIGKFKILQNFSLDQALISYINQNKGEFKQSVSAEGLCRYHGSVFGKVCILYQNNSQKRVTQELQFQFENVEVANQKVNMASGQTKLLTFSIGYANNCSHKCGFKSKTYYFK